MADKHKQAEKDYIKGMKYKDIAEKHGASINTVKSWKRRYGWTREKGAPKQKSVHTKKVGAPKGNKNALGNSGGPGGPVGNNKAETHGFFRTIFPDDKETLEIVDAIQQKSPVDMLWENIVIKYTAIARAQKIMYVEDKDELIKHLKKKKDGDTFTEKEWEFQYAWDRYASFMTAQARAMSELRGLIKDFLQLSGQDDYRRAQLEKMQHDMNVKQRELDLKQKEIEQRNAPPEKPDISEYINAMKGEVKDVFSDEE
ncbi:Uncharacterized protein YjcR [Salinibacillus kushneri]|uniref:Uncharacterized protein YjcR n=1 Tax=Salinibacillus kushneri TaxID=237682 RepID=A0A1I0IDV7_9BACI|nr:phage terminase small subunit [Salinibacillus kushneri]SET94941.1 Uncharacterized protein YjcR [Salinibacillus kushneri]